MKKILKYSGRTLLGFIGFILLYLLSAWCLSRITVSRDPGQHDDVAIYIRTNGVHTDLVVPSRNDIMDWTQQIPFANTAGADTTSTYLAMGWGDKGFYLETPDWSDLKASVAFKAAFGLSTTAIHATYYTGMTESSTCRRIQVGEQQYRQLVAYILHSLKTDRTGRAIVIPTHANYGANDAFYEANGTYSLFRTCNTWANAGLKASGQKCCLWTAFDTGIFKKYE